VGCGVWGVGCGVWGVGCGVWGSESYHVGPHVGVLLVAVVDLAVGVAGPPTHPVVDLGFGGRG